jgi:hypothetical protein
MKTFELLHGPTESAGYIEWEFSDKSPKGSQRLWRLVHDDTDENTPYYAILLRAGNDESPFESAAINLPLKMVNALRLVAFEK